MKAVAELAGTPVIAEGVEGTSPITWRYHDSRPGVAVPDGAAPALLERVAEQTGLELRWERRKVTVWAGVE